MRMECYFYCKPCDNGWYHLDAPRPIINFGGRWQYRQRCSKCGTMVKPFRMEKEEAI